MPSSALKWWVASLGARDWSLSTVSTASSGERGAGKTTALELLRFGLGLMPDPKANPQRHRSIDALVKANLGSGRVRIELRTKTDMRYSADRSTNESVQVVNEVGVAVPISLDRDLIFGADVFSQNEIEEIASSPAAQLALLDRFQEEDTLAITRGLSELQRQLEQSGGRASAPLESRGVAVLVRMASRDRLRVFLGTDQALWQE